MNILIITTVKTTTSEPYAQLPPDRIELQPTPAGNDIPAEDGQTSGEAPHLLEHAPDTGD